MIFFIKFLGILFILLGILNLLFPKGTYDFIKANQEKISLYIVAIVGRFLLGILFITAAHESKYPGVINVVGYLNIITALIFVFIGHKRFIKFMSSILNNINLYAFVGGLIGIVFGAFLIYAF